MRLVLHLSDSDAPALEVRLEAVTGLGGEDLPGGLEVPGVLFFQLGKEAVGVRRPFLLEAFGPVEM